MGVENREQNLGVTNRFIRIDVETTVMQTSRARRLFKSQCGKSHVKLRLQHADNDENYPE